MPLDGTAFVGKTYENPYEGITVNPQMFDCGSNFAIKDVQIRLQTEADLDALMEIEQKVWPSEMQCTKAHFLSRMRVFPEGCMVAEVDGQIAGISNVQIIDFDFEYPPRTWYEATDGGMITGTHDPNGNSLFGVNLTENPDFANKGIAEALLEANRLLAYRKNLVRATVEARIPRYHKECHRMSVEDYVFTLNSYGWPVHAKELWIYMKLGMRPMMIVPEYIDDPASMGYAVIMVWGNPFYNAVPPSLAKIKSAYHL